MSEDHLTARTWLIINNYYDVVKMIDEIMQHWKKSGKKTRRDWWEVLAGGENGKPKIVDGKEFPVLVAAQRYFGLPVTPNAIIKQEETPHPIKQKQNRWNNREGKK